MAPGQLFFIKLTKYLTASFRVASPYSVTASINYQNPIGRYLSAYSLLFGLYKKKQFVISRIDMGQPHLKKKRYAIVLAIILMAIMATISQSQWLVFLELKTVDVRTHWLRKDIPAPSDIVLILIDEASLDSMQALFGRWPWPRKTFANIIKFLSECGAKSILIDVLFTERQLLKYTDSTLSEDDRALVVSTRNAQNVYHSAQFTYDPEDEYNLSSLNRPLPTQFVRKFAQKDLMGKRFSTANTYYLPFRELYLVSKGIGVVSILPDDDGVYRRVTHFTKYGQYLYPSLSLSPLLTNIQPDFKGIENISVTLPGKKVQHQVIFDSDYKSYINMYGKFDVYSFGGIYLSLMKIDQGILTDLPVSPEVFMGKTIFIGASASGVKDLKRTALGPQTPGVFLHASAYGNIITDDFLRFSPDVLQPAIMIVMVALSVTAFFLLDSLILKILLPLSTLILWGLAALILFTQNLSIPMAGPVIAVFCTYVVSLSFLSVTEGRERRKIKNVLGQYVAPSVLSKVLENPTEEFMRAEVGSKEELSIFFSDIRGFSTLAERHPVEKVVELLNNYLSAMTKIIFDKHGTLDKFIGDAIVAFWGAPLRDDRHPYRAVQSAIEMQHALSDMNQKNKRRNLPQLNVGIGIHTDHVILGNIGSYRKLDYTVIGDGVNLASRLEGLTKMYNTPILISQSTYDRVRDDFSCRVVDYVKVKGKQKPIRVYSVLGTPSNVDSDVLKIINLTETAFDKYVHRNFKQAENILTQILTLKPKDYLATLLLFRCREYQLNPPLEPWDGYYEYQTK